MTVLFRSFASASSLLALAMLNCAFLVLVPETGPTASALLLGCTALAVLLAVGGVAAGVFLQKARNRHEAAYREACLATGRRAGEPVPPGFSEALHEREEQLRRMELRTPAGQKRRFAAELLACACLGLAVNAVVSYLLLKEGAGPHSRALEVLGFLPGLLAVSLYGTYKLHLVNRLRDLRLLQTMLVLGRAELGEGEELRRKDLWVIRYLRRTLLQIVYEPA